MGILRASSAVSLLALAACGSDHATPDAAIIIPDAAPDAPKVFNDAPPKNYDLTCFGVAAPTSAPATISIAGTTQSFGGGGTTTVPEATLTVYKNTTSLGTGSSDSTGAFSITNIATGGTPVDGYVVAAKTDYRTTYMYPPSPAAGNLTGVPVLMVANDAFTMLQQATGTQDDTMNGYLLFAVTDCKAPTGAGLSSLSLISDATVSVEQNGSPAGDMFSLGVFLPQLAGVYLVGNVPDGATQIKVSYNGMNFPTRTVVAHKQADANSPGTLTFTAVRPGP